MNIPTPGLKVASHYSYELNPPVHLERSDVVTDANGFGSRPLEGDVCRVGVIVHEWNGERRPAVIVATTTTARAASAQAPLDGHELRRGPNEDVRLLDVFADLIADAEQRHAQATGRAAHPANQPPPSRVPGTGHPAYLTQAAPAVSAAFPRDFELAHPVIVPAGTVTTVAAIAEQAGGWKDEPTHLCQHGNLIHPCACPSPQDHGRRLCQGVKTDA